MVSAPFKHWLHCDIVMHKYNRDLSNNSLMKSNEYAYICCVGLQILYTIFIININNIMH